MKYKLSVIFLFLCSILFLIYNKFDESNINILYIGESNTFYKLYNDLDKFEVNKFLFEDVTYDELNNFIDNNIYKVIKDKYIYLNQEIRKSDIIILNANNFEYKLKCRRNDRVLNEYNFNVNRDINNLISSLNKIVISKIFVIGNHCDNDNIKLFSDDFVYVRYDELNNIKKILLKYINN